MAEIASSQKRLSLPVFLTHRNKYFYGLLVFGGCSFLYLASNHYHLFQPKLLPTSWVDQHIPFIPHTVWIYFSEYLLIPLAYLRCREILNANKFLYSFLALWLSSVTIFWLWPTTFPREMFPLPEDLDAITFAAFSALRDTDTPANCAPSLHVSSVFLCSFIFLDEQREKFSTYFLWATAIAISTMTTKQHYFVDVVTGLIMATLVYAVFHRNIDYRQANR